MVILGWSTASLVDDPVVLVVPVTSFDGTPKPKLGDVAIRDIQRAGMHKPSWIRARRVFNVHPRSLDRTRGSVGSVASSELAAVYTEIANLLRPGGTGTGR